MTALLSPVGPVVVPEPPPAAPLLTGDPGAAAAAARRLLAAAQDLHDVQVRLTSDAGDLLGRRLWCGPASGAFQRGSRGTATWFDNAARALALVAAALTTYAGALADAEALARRAAVRGDAARRERAALLAEIEVGRPAGPDGLLFGLSTFDPATVALQRRADALAAEIHAVRTALDDASALVARAERTAAAAFDEATAMTAASRARAAVRPGAPGSGPGSAWLDLGELVGLGVTDLLVGAVDAAQGGLDPLTDAAEVSALGRTGEVASRLVGRFGADQGLSAAGAEVAQAAETEALAAEQAGGDWLAAARAQLPEDWGPGVPASRGDGYRWIEPEGQGSYLRVDPGRAAHPDPLQQVDHVHVRHGGARIGRDGLRLPTTTVGLTEAEREELARLEHVPLTEWLTWRSWWHR